MLNHPIKESRMKLTDARNREDLQIPCSLHHPAIDTPGPCSPFSLDRHQLR
jgi:hypothetical protein